MNNGFDVAPHPVHLYSREQVQVPIVLWGEIDLKKLQFSITFNASPMTDSQGEVELQVRSAAVSREFRWMVDAPGLARLGELRNQRHSSAGETGLKKFAQLETVLNRVFEAYLMLDVGETLQDHGTVVKGTEKTALALLHELDNGVTGCFRDLLTKVSVRHDGVDYIRQLLQSENQDRVGIGLRLLMEGPFAAPLDNEIEGIARDVRVSPDVRRLAWAAMSAETRRAVAQTGASAAKGM